MSSADSPTYTFAAGGNVHETRQSLSDSDRPGYGGSRRYATNGHYAAKVLPAGLKMTAADGGDGLYSPYLNDPQMSGEYIHMRINNAAEAVGLEIMDTHAPGVEGSRVPYSFDQGMNLAQVNFGEGSSMIEIPPTTRVNKSLEFQSLNSQRHLSTMTVAPVPVHTALWLFGTALLGFVGLSCRTSLS